MRTIEKGGKIQKSILYAQRVLWKICFEYYHEIILDLLFFIKYGQNEK